MRRRCSTMLVIVLALVVVSALASGRAAADSPNRAAIVVTFSAGHSEARCVEFSEPEISGAELLKRSGIPFVSSSQTGGAAICQIGDVGCANPGDCFCQCRGSGCQYWAYYALVDGQWRYASAGSSLRKIHDGDVDGWAWGSGGIGNGAEPELRPFDDICPPPSQPTASPPSPQPVPATDEPAVPPAGVSPTSQATAIPFPTPAMASTPGPAIRQAAADPTLEAVAEALGEAADPGSRGDGSRLPLQLVLFGALASALLAAAVVLARRRARG